MGKLLQGLSMVTEESFKGKVLDATAVLYFLSHVEVKRAIPRGGDKLEASDGYGNNCIGDDNTAINTKKIFVGGLPLDIKKEEFKSYFESFGTVIDAPVICDKETGRPRGFGFITFDSEDAVNNVLQTRFHELKSKMVEVKRSQPSP